MSFKADKLARLLRILSVGTRVKIARLLKGRSLCVNALASQLDVTQGAVSQHLRVMRNARLVSSKKRGHYVHYHLNEETLATWQVEIDKLLDPTVRDCTEKKGARRCAAATRRRKAAGNRRT